MSKQIVLSVPLIEKRILLIRGQKVMLSSDLAGLYGVKPKTLIQAVKRNVQRFPEDFMFRLSPEETQAVRHRLRSRSQIVTLKRGQNVKYVPYAFTEQGIAMLSSVLRSNTAIQVNITILPVSSKSRYLSGLQCPRLRPEDRTSASRPGALL